MTIKIGADELILWLRKNNKAINRDNPSLGKLILVKIERLGGRKIELQESYWARSESDMNIGEFNLPKDAHQYEIETKSLEDLYEWLTTL
jgi:hypothetical protein